MHAVRRLRLFTEDWPLLDRRGRGTSTYGLWDQGLFTDAIVSAMAGRLIYPYTYLQSPLTGIWKAIGWPPPNASVASLSKQHCASPQQSRSGCRTRLTKGEPKQG